MPAHTQRERRRLFGIRAKQAGLIMVEDIKQLAKKRSRMRFNF